MISIDTSIVIAALDPTNPRRDKAKRILDQYLLG
jgi:predicted nucleic acid-binding protein